MAWCYTEPRPQRRPLDTPVVRGTTNGGTGGPPTGPAGGDLTGSYPNPTIAAGAVGDAEITSVSYAKVTGAPSIPTTLPPSGPAGGDLTGTYPNPLIAAGAVGNAEITDVAWSKLTGVPPLGTTILNGSGPPAPAVGVEGNYYLDVDTHTLYGPKAAVGSGWGSPASMLPNTAPTSSTSGDYTVGNRFTVNAAGRITHLRYWHAASCGGITHALKLWTDAGVLVASTTDTPAAAFAGYRDVALPTPYIVAASERYRVSYHVSGPLGYSALPVTSLTPDLAFHEGYFGYGDAYPDNAGGSNYHADVVYEPGSVGAVEVWPVAIQGAQPNAYRHVQATAANTWTITHNLSFRPNVTAVDSTGRAIWPGALDYTSATSVLLTFSAAVGGEAYLS